MIKTIVASSVEVLAAQILLERSERGLATATPAMRAIAAGTPIPGTDDYLVVVGERGGASVSEPDGPAHAG